MVEWDVKYTTLYREPCNCGDRVMHNNGGNYHAVGYVVVAKDGEGRAAVVIESTTTRETFPRDEFECLVWDGKAFDLISEDEADQEHTEAIARFLSGEARIVHSADNSDLFQGA